VALCTDKCTGQLAACHQAMLLTPVILHRISKEPKLPSIVKPIKEKHMRKKKRIEF
ncbi:MAG: hypothetical protein HY513_00430, partial [Candidatus Aenigmarchaeota archaeon]|nr:hypothetical protein [Candidatus Aenigmarchaeota archaeon]